MAHSKYADGQYALDPKNELEEARRFYKEHPVDLPDARAFTPGRGYGLLAIKSGGDWSWKSGRDEFLGDQMQTFKGVPPSAAELYRGSMHQPG